MIARSLIVVALLVTFAACGGDDQQGIELGNGELPGSVPDDFPLPDGALIGATLVDHDGNRSEFNATIGASVKVVAQYFDQNLPNRGYVLESSTGTDTQWEILVSRDELEATIDLRLQSPEVTVATVRLNRA